MNTSAVSGSSGSLMSSTGTGALDRNAFLKLLITQMSNQDPMKPTDDTEFVSQLAQFSSLEQMQNMNTNLDKFVGVQTLTQATGWIGKAIQWVDAASGKNVAGQVKSVTFEDGVPSLVVPMNVSVKGSDGKYTQQIQEYNVPMSSVNNVFTVEETQTVSSALSWIGRNVTGTELGGTKTITGKVTGVEFRNGVTVLNMKVGDTDKQIALATVQKVAE